MALHWKVRFEKVRVEPLDQKLSTQRSQSKKQGTEKKAVMAASVSPLLCFEKFRLKNCLTQRRKAESQGAEKIPEAICQQALRLSFPFAPLR
jgi:hypothetical protein